jgi:hypothetical protein
MGDFYRCFTYLIVFQLVVNDCFKLIQDIVRFES